MGRLDNRWLGGEGPVPAGVLGCASHSRAAQGSFHRGVVQRGCRAGIARSPFSRIK